MDEHLNEIVFRRPIGYRHGEITTCHFFVREAELFLQR